MTPPTEAELLALLANWRQEPVPIRAGFLAELRARLLREAQLLAQPPKGTTDATDRTH